MTPVVRHIIDSIAPVSGGHADAARRTVASAGAPILTRLAGQLAGAQHAARPRTDHRTIVVCAADHDAADPGISLGDAHPTIVAARAIADGSAALAQIARGARAPIVLVDAGVREPAAMPASSIALGGPIPLTVEGAALGVEAGVALAVSLADHRLDLLAIGAIGLGPELTAAALLASDGDPIDRLATAGGPETCVLAGLILGAASMQIPTILDGQATGAAALIAAVLAPAAAGYVIAAHRGDGAHPQILATLGIEPLFEVGLGHGEGTGAAMALALVDQVAALIAKG